MNKTPFLILALLIAATATSCINAVTGKGPITEQTRDLPEFNKLALNIDASVLITQSSNQSVKVHSQENLHDIIMTRVDGSTLVITSKGTVMNSQPIKIEISMKNPEAFEVNGSGEIKCMNRFQANLLDFEINGSGEITADVSCEKLSTAISGSGKLIFSGNASTLDAEIHGSGTIHANGLQVSNSRVQVSGSGNATVYVVDRLKANINGSGTIQYKGTPHLTTEVNGSGSVKALN